MAIVVPKVFLTKCEYMTDPSDDSTRCQKSRNFRLLTRQLCDNQSVVMRQAIKLDCKSTQTGYANYCEMHAILVHYRRNQPQIEYLDKETVFEAMSIYRIYNKLIDLTDRAVHWCQLQNDVLKLGQQSLHNDLISIKQRFKFPIKYTTKMNQKIEIDDALEVK